MKAITAVSLSVCLRGIYYLYLSEFFARWRRYGILKSREFSYNYQDGEQNKEPNQSFAADPGRKQ